FAQTCRSNQLRSESIYAGQAKHAGGLMVYVRAALRLTAVDLPQRQATFEVNRMRRLFALFGILALACAAGAGGLRADDDDDGPDDTDRDAVPPRSRAVSGVRRNDSEKKFRDFGDLTRGSERIDGLFTLHHKDDHLYAEIRHHQFDHPLLAPIA